MIRLITTVIPLFGLCICLKLNAFDIPFSTSFESASIGAEPSGFEDLKDTGFAGNSLNVIADESSFVDGPGSATTGGPGTQSLQWLDTNSTESNPDVVVIDRTYGTTKDVVMRFDYLNVSGNNLRLEVYDDTGTRGIRLDLDNGGTIKNNGSGAILEYTGTNKWLALEITTNLANNTYNLVIERDDRGSPDTYTDLPFNNSIANIATMQFVDVSGASNTAEYYIDNVSVVSIPVIPLLTDFESDTIGVEPLGVASVADTGFAGNSLNVIAAESSFVDGPGSATTGGPGTQALQWLDTNATDSNPDFVFVDLATGTTKDVVMRFDYLNVSGNNLRLEVYDDTGTRGIRLDLDNGGTIKNNGSGAALEYTGTNKWLTLKITTDLSNDTYDLVIERDDRGSPDVFTGLPFNNSIANIATMKFTDSSGASNTSEYYIDNVSINDAPGIPMSIDFESDAIGNEPFSLDNLKDTHYAGNSLNVIAAESSFVDGPGSATTGGLGAQALQWLDTNTTDSNPDVVIIDRGTGITEDVVIRFDYLNVTGDNLRLEIYDETGTRGIRLDLDSGGTIKNNGSGTTLGFTSTNKWHAVEITTNLASDTYDLVVQRDDKASPDSFTGLAFNNSIANIATMQLIDASGLSNTSEYYIDNISIDIAPPSVNTTGFTTEMNDPFCWSTSVVPESTDTVYFLHAGVYDAPAATTFQWKGIRINSTSVSINPSSGGNAYTIELGSGGISGSQGLDVMGQGIKLDVGTNDQTWSVPLNNFRPAIAGTATITYTNPSRLLLRSNANFDFEGTWRADGGLIQPEKQTDWSGSNDQVEGELLNDGGIRLSNSSYNRIAVSLVGDGFLMTTGANSDNGEVSTLATGSWVNHGDIYGSGNLTVTSSKNYGKLLVNGDISHTGDTTVNNKSAGMTLELGTTSTYAFYPGTNGVNNQINGQDGTNSKLNANGSFVIDTAGADNTDGNSWTLIDPTLLNVTYGDAFALSGFTEEVDGVWTKTEVGHLWTYSETTGVLSVADGGSQIVPSSQNVSDFTFVSGGDADLTIDGLQGLTYQLQVATSLTLGDWANVGSPVAGAGVPIILSYTPTGEPKLFFRVVITE